MLNPHELQLCGDLLGLEQLPVVLGRGPQSPDTESWTASIAAARMALVRRELLDGADCVTDELEGLLHVLGNPAHEIAARRIDEGGMRRLCLASDRRGTRVYATRGPREDSAVALGLSESDGASLRAFLGEEPPLNLVPGNAPLRALQEGLAAAEGFAGCVHALEVAGIAEPQAALIAEVLATATAFTEIVTIVHSSGQASATPAAMVIYDSPAGRIVATPHRAPDSALWVTFAPGTWGRVARGLRALDELAEPALDGGRTVLGA